jgi:basic amino acid/polyamine antiporter, APA family
VTPAVFVLLSLWTLFFVFVRRPLESAAGLLTVLVGLVIYWLAHRRRGP